MLFKNKQVKIFSGCEIKEMKKLTLKVLSIPISNANTEVFP